MAAVKAWATARARPRASGQTLVVPARARGGAARRSRGGAARV